MGAPTAMTDQARTAVDLDDLIQMQAEARTLKLPARTPARSGQLGSHLSIHQGRGMEFAEVRLYQPGDDIRAIDWRVTARRQNPHTKLFQEERERPVLILCDLGPSMFFGSVRAYKQVAAAECSATLAWMGLYNGDRVGGVVFSESNIEVQRPVRRRRAVLRLLDSLSRGQRQQVDSTQEDAASRLNEALVETRRIAHTGFRIYVISDFMQADETSARLLNQLARHNRLSLIRVVDRFERELPPPGRYAIAGGEGTLWIDTGNAAFRDAFDKRVREHETRLENLFRYAGIPALTLDTEQPPTQVLRQLTR